MEWFLSVLLFAISTSFTPGPNNMIAASMGVNFGLRGGWPHIAGVNTGFPFMVLAAGLGLGSLFETWPALHQILKWVGFAWILWLAWKIARASAPEGEGSARPFTYWQSFAFQWVNPKAWMMILGAVSSYTSVGGDVTLEVALIALAFFLIGWPSTTSWTLAGAAIRRWLTNPTRLRLFNYTMAGLLIASMLPLLIP